jgi:ATP-dependent Lon protease
MSDKPPHDGHRARLRQRFLSGDSTSRSDVALLELLLTYKFDPTAHDRRIETDNGWRINLGRGLDIFQRVEKKFSLGFIDQAQRKCKATSITYSRQQ